jgi:iron(II)-dependent oxidoreductase
MVEVPPGCLQMGNEEGRRDEKPVTWMCIDYTFWLDQTEVTNAAYGQPGNATGDNQPRENLTWFEARDFCASRGARLPTEAEWEYAGRGPDGLAYPWGNELIDDNLVFERNSGNQTAPVGSIPAGASWVGALDMAGNVWEWVSSHYQPYPYDAADGREDQSDATAERVFRGGTGSYIDFAASMMTRFRAAPDSRDWFIGFRCARTTLPVS